MSKRILSLVLVLALVLGSFSMAFADTAVTTSAAKNLKDVEGTVYQKAVETLGKLDVLNGYADGTFKPENTITRAEFAAVASRIRGLETAAANSKGATEFKDVPASHWASGYVNVASKNGLIKGMGNGTFAPEAPITYEQAITMIVRALGYEYAAQTLGGYPVGYLSVASQEQLLREIPASEGSQGSPASRGLVALLLNNALDIPKMIQVGYGDQAKWIKSGTDSTRELYLFEDLGLKQLEKEQVTKVDSKKQQVTIGKKGFKASKDFDYVGFEGLRVTAWYNDRTDELIVCKDDGAYKVKYDVVEKTTRKEDEIKLIDEDEKYDIANKAELRFNGKSASLSDYSKTNNMYAKVIIDEFGDVNWIDAYNLDETLVVKNVEKNIAKGYDRKEISDINKYTIVKDGKQISADDLEDKDLVLYRSTDEFAVVVTNIVEGKIDRVYTNAFKFEGKTYDNRDADKKYDSVKYIVGDNLDPVDEDVLEEMQKNGEVKIYFSFDNKPLFIDGEAVDVASSYVMLESDSVSFANRGDQYRTLDVLNSEGKVVKYEIKEKDIDDSKDKIFEEGDLAKWNTLFGKDAGKGKVIKLTTDSANKVTKVESVTKSKTIGRNALQVDDKNAEGFRLQGNAVVFIEDGETKIKDYSAIKWSDAGKEFKEIKKGTVYADKDERVVAIFAEVTDGDTKTEDIVGVVKKAKKTSTGARYDVVIEIDGKEVDYTGKEYVNENDEKDGFESVKDLAGMENEVVVLRVAKGEDGVKGWKSAKGEEVKVDRITSTRLNNDIDIEGKIYRSDLKDTVNANIISKGDTVTVYFQPGSTKYAKVVRVGAHGGPIGPETPAEKEAREFKEAKAAFGTALATETAEKATITAGKTADSIVLYEAAITAASADFAAAKTAAEVNAAKTALEAAKKLLADPSAGNEISGTLVDTVNGQRLDFTVSDGSKVEKIVLNNTELVAADFDYGINGNVVSVADVKTGDVLTVTVEGETYILKF